MLQYITNEEMDLVADIHDNHEKEFRQWADENEDYLMKWYDDENNQKYRMFEAAQRFAYYCAVKFIEHKGSVEEV